MIISNNQIQTLLAQYLKQENKVSSLKNGDTANKSAGDKITKSVSADVRAYSAAKEVIRELPDIRADRLADIQKRVNSGTYGITDEEVAEKMIGRSLVDKLV
ncbi:MAG: flagellar biosynthesis anti-sigma factor FlgM [Thermincola sp.]|jgi:negative regulator of flagellin synthesis FlgM|nr:flagellar biosynthesis anti-sigma factor FlgM [Thermincola sp.]MDT3703390.1 flagellar biosynthesis anti-sigma factor FlgM [Thermincola sp.]